MTKFAFLGAALCLASLTACSQVDTTMPEPPPALNPNPDPDPDPDPDPAREWDFDSVVDEGTGPDAILAQVPGHPQTSYTMRSIHVDGQVANVYIGSDGFAGTTLAALDDGSRFYSFLDPDLTTIEPATSLSGAGMARGRLTNTIDGNSAEVVGGFTMTLNPGSGGAIWDYAMGGSDGAGAQHDITAQGNARYENGRFTHDASNVSHSIDGIYQGDISADLEGGTYGTPTEITIAGTIDGTGPQTGDYQFTGFILGGAQ